LRIGAGKDAAFRDYGAIGGDEGAQTLCGGQVNFESLKIAVVDADEGAAIEEGAFDIVFVVDFDQSIHAEAFGGGFELADFPVFQDRNDEQDAVSARESSFGDLDFVDDEIFAQGWLTRDGTCDGEVVEFAQEPFGLGEDGEAVREGVTVDGGLFCGVEIGGDETFGGGGFFDFGDEAQTVLMLEGRFERAWRKNLSEMFFEEFFVFLCGFSVPSVANSLT
jgi:hypothetical protein